jgi:hypothetical protein
VPDEIKTARWRGLNSEDIMTKSKFYVGRKDGRRVVFKSDTVPTPASHGHLYNGVTGPFRTKRGAQFDAAFGENNPHVRHVRDAERIAKQIA